MSVTLDTPYRTQISIPFLSSSLVTRPRLLWRVQRCLDYKLTLVSAPAGYGKTTLVAHSLADFDADVAWVTIGSLDNNPTYFLQSLVVAIRTALPGACPRTQKLLKPPFIPPADYLITSLLDELTYLARPMIVTVDDYHIIHNPAVHQLVNRWLARQPLPIHLICISDTTPPLPLTRLKANDEVVELRSADLRFEPDEAQSLFDEALGSTLPSEVVAALVERTEGRVGALRLAGSALRGRKDVVETARRLASQPGAVVDYLMEEALARMTTEAQRCLLHTSMLDQVSASLGDALLDDGLLFDQSSVVGRPSSQGLLERLAADHVFIEPLDETGVWFRHHALLRHPLRHRLQQTLNARDLAALHQRAAVWHKAQGYVDEAIAHALAAGELQLAADAVERYIFGPINQENWPTAERWLTQLSAPVVDQRPTLIIANAWREYSRGNIQPATSLLAAAEVLLAQQAASSAALRELQGQLDTLRAWQAQRSGNFGDAVALARRALTLLPTDATLARSLAILFQGQSLYHHGSIQAAVKLFEETANDADQAGTLRVRALFGLSLVYRLALAPDKLRAAAQAMLKLATLIGIDASVAWAHCLLGVLAYEQNHLALATRHLSQAFDLGYRADPLCLRESLVGLALTYQAQGLPDAAQQTLVRLTQLHTERDLLAPAALQLYQARLALLQGNTAEALRLTEALPDAASDEAMLWLNTSTLIRIQVWLAAGSQAQREAGLSRLVELEQYAREAHNMWALVRILALRAFGEQRQGQDEQALATLEQVIRLAQPAGLVRSFVDLGEDLAPLLDRLAECDVAPEYVAQVLAAFPPSVQIASV